MSALAAKRAVLSLLAAFAFLSGEAWAQNPFSTAAQQEWKRSITSAGRFGFPGDATASLPTCNTANMRAVRYDTTTNTIKFCNGTAWGEFAGGAGSFSSLTVAVQSPSTGAVGANLVTNGTFTGNATGWTLGLGGGAPDCAYAANNVTHASGGGTTALEPTTPLTIVAGSVYEVKYTITNWTSGSVTASVGGTNGAVAAFNVAMFELITATNTTNLKITPTNDFAGTIDSIEVYLETSYGPALTLSQTSSPFEFRTSFASSFSHFAGVDAGKYHRSGTANNAFGHQALASLNGGTSNSAAGASALLLLVSGGSNTADGAAALRDLRTGDNNTAVGANALRVLIAGNNNTAVGEEAGRTTLTNGSFNTFVGSDTNPLSDGLSYCHIFGYGASCTASNQLVMGGEGASEGFTEGYLGQGVTKATPSDLRLNATGGSGTDNPGADFTVAGGKGTGTGAGGDVHIQTSPALTTSSTLQTLEDRARVVAKQFTLADATAATIFTLTLGDDKGGGGTVHYCVKAKDAANEQMECGAFDYAGVDITAGAGGETCPNPTKVGTPLPALSAGTLAVTFTATTGTELCNIRVAADTSLTPTELWIKYSFTQNSGQVVTPQ